MQSRRDQVQAYRFVTRRIVSALITGEPETTDLPMRRLAGAMFAGVMVAAIVLAAAGVYGLLTKSSAPLEPNTLVIERETEGRYVYVDGRLHPVLNYASARLALGSAEPTVRRVSRGFLANVPRGTPIGIAQAPDSLPEPDHLLELPWRVCSVPPAGDEPGGPRTVVALQREVTGAVPLGELALYVTDGARTYLLWNNSLLRISERVAVAALGLSAVEPVLVGPQFVNAVAAGPDLRVILPEGFGEVSDIEVDGREVLVGFIYRAVDQHYVMTRDGLVPTGELAVALREAAAEVRVRDITGAQATRVLAGNQRLEPEGFPNLVPELFATVNPPIICAAYGGDGAEALATVVEIIDGTPVEMAATAPQLVPVAQTARDVVATATHVLIGSGQGALVQSVPAAGSSPDGTSLHLITAQGVKYPIGQQNGDARSALGFGDVTPVSVPAALVDLLPTGPTLDVRAARQPAGVGAAAEEAG
jgi:type VII secretion protein EccB